MRYTGRNAKEDCSMPENAIQHSHIYSTYFAPRGRSRIFNLGIQLAQL